MVFRLCLSLSLFLCLKIFKITIIFRLIQVQTLIVKMKDFCFVYSVVMLYCVTFFFHLNFAYDKLQIFSLGNTIHLFVFTGWHVCINMWINNSLLLLYIQLADRCDIFEKAAITVLNHATLGNIWKMFLYWKCL